MGITDHESTHCLPPSELMLALRPHVGSEIINTPRPLLAWAIADDGSSENHQTAFRILVARSLHALFDEKGDCWDSGKVGILWILVTIASNNKT